MERRLTIPGTDVSFAPIARGAGGWVGDMAMELIDPYLDLGGQVIDTARLYGFPQIGASEKSIGKWFRQTGRRHDVILMTKGGHPELKSMHTPRMSMEEMTSDLNESLKALCTDYIDIYFYHRDDASRPVGELLEQMEHFRREGKLRFYACSNWTVERMREADAYAAAHGLQGFVGNEAFYNMASDACGPLPDDTLVRADAAMLDYHRQSRCMLMPYSSLANGFFHTLLTPGKMENSRMRSTFYYTEGNLRQGERIRAIMDKYGATVTQVMMGFFTVQELPILPLMGCRSREHIEEMMAALTLPFTADDYA